MRPIVDSPEITQVFMLDVVIHNALLFLNILNPAYELRLALLIKIFDQAPKGNQRLPNLTLHYRKVFNPIVQTFNPGFDGGHFLLSGCIQIHF